MNWKEIYERESPALFSHLLARGCAPDLAEDLIHEVFLGAMAAKAQVKSPRAYLFQASRNALARYMSREALLTTELPDIVSPMSESAQATEPGEEEAVNAALRKLPVDQREVVVLRIWHDFSFREIGEALGIPTDTAASRWRYGSEKLRAMLQRK